MPSRRTLAAVALLGALTLAAACGSGSEAGNRKDPGTVGPTTRATDTTLPSEPTDPTTAGPETTTSTAPGVPTAPTMHFPDRDAAIDFVINAWKFGNRDGAYAGADREAVDNLFTQSPDGFSRYGCDEGGFDTSTCNYRNRGANLYAQITAEKEPEGWIVTSIYMSTDG